MGASPSAPPERPPLLFRGAGVRWPWLGRQRGAWGLKLGPCHHVPGWSTGLGSWKREEGVPGHRRQRALDRPLAQPGRPDSSQQAWLQPWLWAGRLMDGRGLAVVTGWQEVRFPQGRGATRGAHQQCLAEVVASEWTAQDAVLPTRRCGVSPRCAFVCWPVTRLELPPPKRHAGALPTCERGLVRAGSLQMSK